MKTAFRVAALAVLLVTPGECFALWDIETVTKDRAKELGMEVRSEAAGPNRVQVELEFKVERDLKDFRQVELRIGERDNPPLVTAPLREDRSKPGCVVVSFTADRAQLDKLTLWVMAPKPKSLSNTVYELRLKDFVKQEQAS